MNDDPSIALVVIELLEAPQGKGRPRRDRMKNGAMVTHTPEATREYEGNFAYAARQAMGSKPPFPGPLNVAIEARFPIPASWSEHKKQRAVLGLIRPTVKPDWNNLGGVTDALNQIVWVDDKQITDAQVTKLYSRRPSLIVRAWPAWPPA
jgi:Holliday junction resolvase RusA-like endonuclease